MTKTWRARLIVEGCDHRMFATMRFSDGGGDADEVWVTHLTPIYLL